MWTIVIKSLIPSNIVTSFKVVHLPVTTLWVFPKCSKNLKVVEVSVSNFYVLELNKKTDSFSIHLTGDPTFLWWSLFLKASSLRLFLSCNLINQVNCKVKFTKKYYVITNSMKLKQIQLLHILKSYSSTVFPIFLLICEWKHFIPIYWAFKLSTIVKSFERL